jgi:hypothetical protein
MPGTTATQGLIYPVGTDLACDGAEQLEVLARGINGRFDVLDALVDDGENPPMALVEWRGDTEGLLSDVKVNGGTIWNTVQVDTADAFDAGVSPIALRLPYIAPGQLWEIGMYAKGEWSSPGGSDIVSYTHSLIVRDEPGNVVHWAEEVRYVPSVRGAGGGSIIGMVETGGRYSVAAGWSFTGLDGSTDSRISFAQLWAIKVSEA